MAVKPKPSIKSKTQNKPKAAVKLNKKISSRQAKEVKHQSEERYRTILDETEEAYYELDLAGNFIFMNDATCHHLGYSKEELRGVNFRDHVIKEDVEKMYNYFSNIYKTGKPERAMIYRVKAKDGSIIIVENIGFPLRNQKEEIIGFRGIGRDITERKRMEEALRHSEEKYRAIIENIRDGYFEIDLTGKFTFFNESLCEIHGYPKEELMGMNHRQYADRENAKKVFEAFNKIFRTGKTGSIFDYEIIRKDGTKRQIEVSASLKKDSSGNPTGFRGITRDVTERKQAEEAIRQSEERYRTILDEMKDGYFETDLAGNYTFTNDANCRHLGYSKEDLLGANFRGQMDKEAAETIYKAFSNIYRTGKPERITAYRLKRKDGTTGFAETVGFPLKNQK
jgi:PAS domain S-box-containing protein